MVLVLKLQLRPGKVCSACSVWKLCLGKRGLICGTDPLNPKICLGFVWKQSLGTGVFSPSACPGKKGKLPLHFDAAAQGCSEKAQCKEMGQPLEDQGTFKPVG